MNIVTITLTLQDCDKLQLGDDKWARFHFEGAQIPLQCRRIWHSESDPTHTSMRAVKTEHYIVRLAYCSVPEWKVIAGRGR